MKQDCKTLVGMVAVALLTLAPSFAQEHSGSANRLAGPDQTFVMKAAEGGLAEVQLGNLAEQKASDPAVKQFGQRMVTDHSKANDELKQVASQKSITLPTEPSAKQKAEYDRLSKMSGADFDKAYMKLMVSDHHTDVNEFRRESEHGADPDVKAFAAKTLPVLESHLQLAESTNTQVEKTGK